MTALGAGLQGRRRLAVILLRSAGRCGEGRSVLDFAEGLVSWFLDVIVSMYIDHESCFSGGCV